MMMWVGESVGEFVGEDLEEGGDGGDFGRVVVGFGGLKLLVGGFVEGDGVGERRTTLSALSESCLPGSPSRVLGKIAARSPCSTSTLLAPCLWYDQVPCSIVVLMTVGPARGSTWAIS